MDRRAFCFCAAFGVLVVWFALVGFASADSPKDLAQTCVDVRYDTFDALGNALAELPGAKNKVRELDALYATRGR